MAEEKESPGIPEREMARGKWSALKNLGNNKHLKTRQSVTTTQGILKQRCKGRLEGGG